MCTPVAWKQNCIIANHDYPPSFFLCTYFTLLWHLTGWTCFASSCGWHDRQVEAQQRCTVDRLHHHSSCLQNPDSLPVTSLLQACRSTHTNRCGKHAQAIVPVCVTAPVGVFGDYSDKPHCTMHILALFWTLNQSYWKSKLKLIPQRSEGEQHFFILLKFSYSESP